MCCDKNIICQNDEDTRKGFCSGGRRGKGGRRFSDYLIFRCGSLNNKKRNNKKCQKNKNEAKRGDEGKGSISATFANLFRG